MSEDPRLDAVRALQTMGLAALREEWAARYGEPPRLRSVDLLRRMLAWRIQTAAFGKPAAELQRLLRQKEPAQPGLPIGSKAVREWQGVRHEIEIVEKGVLYDGRLYDSLSAVARDITGVRWNGPRFFGLRPPS